MISLNIYRLDIYKLTKDQFLKFLKLDNNNFIIMVFMKYYLFVTKIIHKFQVDILVSVKNQILYLIFKNILRYIFVHQYLKL